MSRPLVATIRLDHLRHNYLEAKRLTGSRALAAIKANAYGHGAVRCAQALHDIADGFGVAAIEEALELRDAGISNPVMLLEGWFEASELAQIAEHQLWSSIHCFEQLEQLEKTAVAAPLTLWVKVDSGMHRLGFAPECIAEVMARLKATGKIANLNLMTHFARADETDCDATAKQIATFSAIAAQYDGEISLANSGGIQAWRDARGDWCRPGIMLYGGRATDKPGLATTRPVMQLDSAIIAVRELDAGEPVGYGARFISEQPTRVGVVACGYADGYPRVAPTGTPVLVNGVLTRVIGRVSMDMLTVDLTNLPDAGVGSHVRLWGEGLPAHEVAESAGTLDYEIFCNVKRARFNYVA
ncbi:alanine racemase [Burkholderiaceae bacterium DAT-1]|nr:alanine racemase [Burkholderiaceae bacterium DAT-1]